jgi:hypothetical protein
MPARSTDERDESRIQNRLLQHLALGWKATLRRTRRRNASGGRRRGDEAEELDSSP